MPFKTGNKLAADNKRWKRALIRALAERDDSKDEKKATRTLQRIALKVVDGALEGDKGYIEEIASRIDGKPTQTLDATVNHIVDLRDSATLEDKLKQAITGRLEESAEPPKRTLQ